MKFRHFLLVTALVGASTTLVAAQDTAQKSAPPSDRRAFFGELHLHTTMSFDAWTFGTKVTPDQAYKFARGETVMVPAVQVQKEQGIPATADVPAKRAWPLDFTAVTDHSESLGAMTQLDDPDSAFSKSPTGKSLHAGRTSARSSRPPPRILGKQSRCDGGHESRCGKLPTAGTSR